MSTGRMRRIDEAIRQVIGEAVAGELKDPRVGFVTVTDVRTSADLSHARVYVSVLGDAPEQREATSEGLRSAHGYLQRRVAAQLRLKRTPTLSSSTTTRPTGRMRVDELIDGEESVTRWREQEGYREAVGERPRARTRAHPRGHALRARHAREPRRRRARLAGGNAGAAERTRQGLADVHRAASELPLPQEYRWFALDHLIQERPPDIAERTVVFLDCGNIDRNSAEVLRDGAHLLNVDHHHDNTHFGTLDYVVARRLLHGRDHLGSDARAGGRADARGRRGAVRRAGHRYRALHVREHGPRAHQMAAELIAAGVDSQAIYRGSTRTCLSPRSSCWTRARQRAAL